VEKPDHRHRWLLRPARERPRGCRAAEQRLEVSVTFDERRGYIGSAPELRSPVVALSLGGLRRRIEALMLRDNVNVQLILDRIAERERNRRRQQAQTGEP
jgi:hypothetical protein